MDIAPNVIAIERVDDIPRLFGGGADGKNVNSTTH